MTVTVPKSGGIALHAAIPGTTRLAANETVASVLSRCANPVAYRADPTGKKDRAAAFRAAAAGRLDAICITIPPAIFASPPPLPCRSAPPPMPQSSLLMPVPASPGYCSMQG